MSKKKVQVWLPLLFSIVLILGMVLGFKLRDSLRNKKNFTTIIQRNDRLEDIIQLIEQKYVDSVNTNMLYADAVNGILNHLDPHTVYIPADELSDVNEDLEGSFFGIGVGFSIIRDTLNVTSVVEGGPSANAGLKVGDKMLKVGDSVIAGTKMPSDDIIKMLKGPESTEVKVTIQSITSGNEEVKTIVRGRIPIYSVDADIMLDNATGYIKINRFSATTYKEFSEALKKLKRQGMQQLVVDLRQNPGGYLNAAAKIADEFLSGDKLIVYTNGNNTSREEYRAGEKNGFEQQKLIILVDESSASASEILAGAVQDWDRGLIIGRRTYGKGLVQEQYRLQDGSAMRLTVAKYYVPSGRSIQRSYKDGKEAYSHDFYDRLKTGELTGNDTVSLADTTPYYTGNKRIVYGGGGITPDVYVPYDTSRLNSKLIDILYSQNVRNMIWDYYLNNRKQLRATYATANDFNNDFDEQTLFKQYLSTQDKRTLKTINMMLKQGGNAHYFRVNMKAQLARYLFDDDGYYKVMTGVDDVVQKALEVLSNNDEYSKVINGG